MTGQGFLRGPARPIDTRTFAPRMMTASMRKADRLAKGPSGPPSSYIESPFSRLERSHSAPRIRDSSPPPPKFQPHIGHRSRVLDLKRRLRESAEKEWKRKGDSSKFCSFRRVARIDSCCDLGEDEALAHRIGRGVRGAHAASRGDDQNLPLPFSPSVGNDRKKWGGSNTRSCSYLGGGGGGHVEGPITNIGYDGGYCECPCAECQDAVVLPVADRFEEQIHWYTKERPKRLAQARDAQEAAALSECTFHPYINESLPNYMKRRDPRGGSSPLRQLRKYLTVQSDSKYLQEVQDMRECTFQPNVEKLMVGSADNRSNHQRSEYQWLESQNPRYRGKTRRTDLKPTAGFGPSDRRLGSTKWQDNLRGGYQCSWRWEMNVGDSFKGDDAKIRRYEMRDWGKYIRLQERGVELRANGERASSPSAAGRQRNRSIDTDTTTTSRIDFTPLSSAEFLGESSKPSIPVPLAARSNVPFTASGASGAITPAPADMHSSIAPSDSGKGGARPAPPTSELAASFLRQRNLKTAPPQDAHRQKLLLSNPWSRQQY